MTVIFSRKCELGLQAVLYLTVNNHRKVVPSDEIAKKLNIPKEFVSKILQNLTSSGIVNSKKGKNGGFTLAKDASKIKLIDIVKAIDGLSIFDNCVLGFPKCSSQNPCPVHNKWGELREKAYNMLNSETLAVLKNKAIKKINKL
ncbi:MAG: Rrf2 family transcriptional regulator [Ignavibacterium sp.]